MRTHDLFVLFVSMASLAFAVVGVAGIVGGLVFAFNAFRERSLDGFMGLAAVFGGTFMLVFAALVYSVVAS